MRLIFGAITCDARPESLKNSITFEQEVHKNSASRLQNVFVHPIYEETTDQESADDDLNEGYSCESVAETRDSDSNNKDIALIRLDHPFSDSQLNFETTNINTICVEHSTKVTYTMDRPLTAFAAGFGDKDQRDDRQPFLSFLRLSVFQYGKYSWTRSSNNTRSTFFLLYKSEVSNEQQFAIDLEDEFRDTNIVCLTLKVVDPITWCLSYLHRVTLVVHWSCWAEIRPMADQGRHSLEHSSRARSVVIEYSPNISTSNIWSQILVLILVSISIWTGFRVQLEMPNRALRGRHRHRQCTSKNRTDFVRHGALLGDLSHHGKYR